MDFRVREAKHSDLPALCILFKQYYPVHNIFDGDESEVIPYLGNQIKKNKSLVIEHNGKMIGFVLVKCVSKNLSHYLWQFKHVCVKYREALTALLGAAEDYASMHGDTNKIELLISQSEPLKKTFLENGYKHEATLFNHYRLNESMFMFGKLLRR